MDGVITGREVLAHFRLIWREFGFGCLLRCVRASLLRERSTFLSIAWKTKQ